MSLLATLSSCTVKRSADNLAVLRYPLGSDPVSLDPATADTGVAVFVLNQIVSTLLDYDAKQGIVFSDASGYEWREKGRKLFVTVRRDLRWSDGAALTACQYRDGILRALDPAVPSALSELLFEIVGAKERKGGKVTEDKVGVRCSDENATIEFDVVRPRSAKMLHALAFVVSAPLRKEAAARRGSDWLLPEDGKAGLATGAFAVSEWARDRRITLAARSFFEMQALPEDRRAKLRSVEMPVVRDPTAALALYESGDVDLFEEIPPALLPRLRERADRVQAPYFTTYMVGFSFESNPVLKDARVRRALAMSFRQEEVPQILQGGEQEARGWVPPGLIPGDMRPTASIFDASKARALLAEAGYADPSKFPVLKLFYNSGERHKLLMERAANNWKTQLGVKVELEPIEWKVLVAQLKTRAPDLWRYAWSAAYPDALFFLELWLSDGLNNFGKWKNAEYDRLVNSLLDTPFDARDAKFWSRVARAQEILVREDPALIPVYHYVRNALVRPGIYGLEFTGRGTGLLKNVEKRAPPQGR
jgi:oligopeptide transport system substrate-binding protein